MIGATDISAPVGTSTTTTTGDHRRPTDLLVGFFPLIRLYIFLGNHVHLPGLTSSEIRPKLSHPRFDLSQSSLSLNQGLSGKGKEGGREGEEERNREKTRVGEHRLPEIRRLLDTNQGTKLVREKEPTCTRIFFLRKCPFVLNHIFCCKSWRIFIWDSLFIPCGPPSVVGKSHPSLDFPSFSLRRRREGGIKNLFLPPAVRAEGEKK